MSDSVTLLVLSALLDTVKWDDSAPLVSGRGRRGPQPRTLNGLRSSYSVRVRSKLNDPFTRTQPKTSMPNGHNNIHAETPLFGRTIASS
jgi:hypothetical protein